MAKHKKVPKWKRLSLSTDGRVINIRHNDIDLITLADLLLVVLKEIPNSSAVMQLVLDKYTNDHGN